jgi:hypothetical protein
VKRAGVVGNAEDVGRSCGFTGCTPLAANTCTVVMTAAKSVSAAFQVP